jgi:micrococcal nuclease
MRLPRLTKRKVIGAIVFILISITTQFIPQQKKEIKQNNSFIKVSRVIDGDTIELENGKKVRYIGIDSPELHHPKKSVECFGKEAYEENKKLVEGKIVKLEKDVSETDRYGRLLRYVFLSYPPSTPEALFVNKYLVNEGYAYAATFPPDVMYSQYLLNAQQEARINNRGLWKSCQ